jgi:hypothetical protein
MSIDWSKAPAHATHWCPGNARIEEGWIYKAGQEFYSCYAEKSCEHIPNFPAWRALRLIPRRVEPAPWNGEGLPPVGTVCEWHPNNDGWIQVEILGHSGEETWFRRDGHELSETCLRMAFFRPIRTPEQIAAEERIAELNKMIGCINDHPNKYPGATHLTQLKIQEDACIDLYDAGYRKQVTP